MFHVVTKVKQGVIDQILAEISAYQFPYKFHTICVQLKHVLPLETVCPSIRFVWSEGPSINQQDRGGGKKISKPFQGTFWRGSFLGKRMGSMNGPTKIVEGSKILLFLPQNLGHPAVDREWHVRKASIFCDLPHKFVWSLWFHLDKRFFVMVHLLGDICWLLGIARGWFLYSYPRATGQYTVYTQSTGPRNMDWEGFVVWL